MKKIAISQLSDLFAAISAQQKLYIPADNKGQAQFLPYVEGLKLSESLNTVRSAKDLFFPQTENIIGFEVEGKSISVKEIRDEVEPFVVFGVRACDAASFDILDRVFLSEPADSFYAHRRANGTVVTMACGKPEETCICTAFGIDATEPKGDVSCWMTADSVLLKANTEKGEALLAKLSLEDASDDAADAAKAEAKAILEKLPLKNLDLEGFNGENLMKWFNSPAWDKLSESCLGCGTCTLVCPTCQCYDVRDFDTGHGVERFRCWDSCMYSDFTMMAHGTNRPTQKERFRQRFMHKLVYFPANNDGVYGCVGCGRCLAKCPISMNIVKVAKTLKEGQ